MFCRRITGGENVCPECERELPVCGAVRSGGEFFSKCAAAFYYRGGVRRAVLAMKFGRRRSYARNFGDFVAGTVREHLTGEFDVITWAPLSARRRWTRGFDQAELIARRVGEILGVPVIRALVKCRHTRPQSGLRREARAANASGAYRAADPETFRGLRVLIVDDVITSGATLSECARVLLMAGAEDVVCAAAAKAGLSKNMEK